MLFQSVPKYFREKFPRWLLSPKTFHQFCMQMTCTEQGFNIWLVNQHLSCTEQYINSQMFLIVYMCPQSHYWAECSWWNTNILMSWCHNETWSIKLSAKFVMKKKRGLSHVLYLSILMWFPIVHKECDNWDALSYYNTNILTSWVMS